MHGHSCLHSTDKTESQALAPWGGKIHPAPILLTGTTKPRGKGQGHGILIQEIRKDGKQLIHHGFYLTWRFSKPVISQVPQTDILDTANMAHKPNTACAPPLVYALQAKKGFCIFKCYVQIKLYHNKATLIHLSIIYAAFALQGLRWGVITEPLWPEKSIHSLTL